MKIFPFASSIVFILCFLLAACDSIHVPDVTGHDEVPPAVKAEPRLVEQPPPLTGNEPWPRLGDVPFKPKDFSTQPVYNHYMNELEYDRGEADAAKQKVRDESSASGTTSPGPFLVPPQLPKE